MSWFTIPEMAIIAIALDEEEKENRKNRRKRYWSIDECIRKKTTTFRETISPEEKLAVTLRYFIPGCTFTKFIIELPFRRINYSLDRYRPMAESIHHLHLERALERNSLNIPCDKTITRKLIMHFHMYLWETRRFR
ncbi:hypothetical protein ACJJTC_007869 [Scirpophaga incertulas]